MRKAAIFLVPFIGTCIVSLSAQEVPAETPETLSGRPLDYNNLARLPYQQLIKIAQSDARSDPNADEYRLRIQSRNQAVQSGDIELFLNLEDGPLVLVVDNDGYVTVPYQKELLEANPDLIANQPKGSLNIYVDLEVP